MVSSRWIAFLLLASLSACRRDDAIQTYRVSKESAPTMAMPAAAAPGGDMNATGQSLGLSAAGSSKDLTWTVPSGWESQAPSAMRIGSFLIHSENGQAADVSVVPLAGEAGGDLANINRWRGQLNLAPTTEEALVTISHTESFAGHSMRWIEFVSDEKMIDNRYKRRLVAAIYKQGKRSWFFKMIGEDQTVQTATPAFRRFLQSLHFS